MPLDPRTFPRPPLLERISKHLLVKWPADRGGQVIAETRRGYWVLETYHPPSMRPTTLVSSLPCAAFMANTYCMYQSTADC